MDFCCDVCTFYRLMSQTLGGHTHSSAGMFHCCDIITVELVVNL